MVLLFCCALMAGFMLIGPNTTNEVEVASTSISTDNSHDIIYRYPLVLYLIWNFIDIFKSLLNIA